MNKALFLIPSLLCSSFVQADTLQEAIHTTLKTNPDVLASISERQAVSKEIDQAQAGYFPTIDLGLGTGWESTDNPASRNRGDGEIHLNRDEASLNLRQMLYDGSLTKNEVERQKARTDSRAHSVYSVAENTALEATEAYLNVLRRQKLVELAQTNLESHLRTHDQITLRSERGVGRRADMDQSLGRLALAETNLMAEQSNLRDAETNYLRVVGEAPSSLSQPPSPEPFLPMTVEEAVNIAIQNHPTLRSAQADVASANAQHDVTKAAFLPRVDFELGTRNDHDIDGVRGTDKDVTAMFRLRYNLLNGGKDKARREETAFLINQAAEIRNNTHRQVEQSVRLSWNALETVRRQMSYFEEYAAAAEKTRDAYQQQFNFGQRTLLDLLDSENELFRARIALTNAQYDEIFTMYRVLNSIGLLLESLEIIAPAAATTVADNRK
ncbi:MULTISPECIES: TolC family outer membrane protein [unclassified Methylophaga]|jgi:adhesin transport system outer membrane protein|uniref:TolC family outer membrane protein n=2 Tax=Methylophaga TaxID=40222 RepID=UPI0025F8C9A0|nr:MULTISPECIES: TolC family outer membrane protein [unclassified Methylophaga]MDX1751365.1 TolC family outer membrane protein [Methylophaga sp.]|tara:strand:+ start:19915 stop:21234 length:1320 start_codon:yes stop_codon:yes gene_type:complete